jgi:hypothetical protein
MGAIDRHLHLAGRHRLESSHAAQIIEAHGESREGDHIALGIRNNNIDCELRQKRDDHLG